MNKILLAASAATLAFAPAFAGPGGGQGGGHGENGGGHDGGGMQAMGGGHGVGHGGGAMHIEHADRGAGHARAEHAIRRQSRPIVHESREVRHGEAVGFDSSRGNHDFSAQRAVAANGFVDNCPPGLAAKGNGCLPPGQARKLVGSVLPGAYARLMLSGPYADWYRDDDRYLYRMADNSIYRVNRGTNLIDALIPYGGNDFSYYPVGMNYPADYNYYNVPTQYRGYYPDGGDYQYRYGDNAIYSVNPQNSAIQSIVALLAGDLGVGQRLPSSYGVYNVPLSYRDRYADTADNWYRYNDGYIYRVDPRSQLITSAISALI